MLNLAKGLEALMILVTGGAGFIGSGLIWGLNQIGFRDIVVCDRLGTGYKWQNLAKRQIYSVVHKDDLFAWLEASRPHIHTVFHIGACSSTTETDADYLMANNFQYSVRLFQYCTERRIPFFYASSAATYGAGEHGYDDVQTELQHLRPINKYGYSKHLFDQWVLAQKEFPSAWAGFKFFNVYGPGESHKGAQASVVYHAFPQVRDTKSLRLFKSYRDDVAHGEQKRDFVYVKDVVKTLLYFYTHRTSINPGIYNLGTGHARTFRDLGSAVFQALSAGTPRFEWVDMPPGIKDQYQYFTEARLENLRRASGYDGAMTTLEDGIRDYVLNYLATDDPYL